ncbi:MAG: hypothetical protein OQK57_05040 [Ignavibacteriaceae bacterium]|nr:hypothetical protein [Ignavibacteriaceae bacterium]
MKIILLSVSIFISALFFSCKDDPISNPVGNQEPNTGLFLYPDSTIGQQLSRLQVHWWGDDPDGTIKGFYIKWEGIDSAWSFTTSNDSIFSLPIGTSDTVYTFKVVSVDAEGNGTYDQEIVRNGVSFGPEPFVDANQNGMYDAGEVYYDIGLIDPTPASLVFPIKNSAPVVEWSALSFVPDTSFPVMTFQWNANDLDGVESISSINISLNDTNSFVSLPGSIRLVTIRIKDLNASTPEMEILINGSDGNIYSESLPGLQLDAENKFYVQAVDLSGAASERIVLPGEDVWYVKKPKGKVLIFDDFVGATPASNQQAMLFYRDIFNTIGGGSLNGKFDEYDVQNEVLPFENVTVYEMMRLFRYVYWYSGSNPRLNLLNIVTNKYIEQGGKIAFSMTFQDSSSNFIFDLSTLQGFLPIDDVSNFIPFLFAGADIIQSSPQINYPSLKTSAAIDYVRTFVPNSIVANEIYNISSSQISGNIGMITNDKTLFFMGLPLHQCNGGNQNVDDLLEKIFFDEFGLIP